LEDNQNDRVSWRKEEKTINDYIDRIRENFFEENEKGWNKLPKLVGRFILTKQQKFSEYRDDLDKLQKIKYGYINKAELKEKIQQINKIRSAVEKDSSEIHEETRKADLQEKIEENKKKKEELEAELGGKRQILQKTEETIKIQFDSLKKLEKKGEEKEKNEARKKTEGLNTALNKIQNEISSLENQIKKFTAEEKELTEQLKKPVKEPPKRESVLSVLRGGGKKPSQPEQENELPVPQLRPLPSVGDLYIHNERDYLAISNWEDYDDGKSEAERLRAKLCAKGENNG